MKKPAIGLSHTLVKAVDAETGLGPERSREAVAALLATVRHELAAGLPVRLPGLGTFTTPLVQARKGYNPQTGEALAIPARRRVRFKPTQPLKARVAGLPGGGEAS